MADVCLFVIFCVFTHALDRNDVCVCFGERPRERERERVHRVICAAECYGAKLVPKCLHRIKRANEVQQY